MTNNINLVSGGAVSRIDRTAAITPDRRHFIGGSDARIIMGKDEKALLRLWREKRGEAAALDLSSVLIVQLGLVTEDLNRRWYELNSGHRVTDVQRHAIHRTMPWMAATLDGLVKETGAVFEAKFMLPWSFSEEAAPDPQRVRKAALVGIEGLRNEPKLDLIDENGGGPGVRLRRPEKEKIKEMNGSDGRPVPNAKYVQAEKSLLVPSRPIKVCRANAVPHDRRVKSGLWCA
jgi:YqaJ-like viral recombinase domain